MSENNPHETMPLAEVAAFLGVSDYTVLSWAEEGGLETAGSPFVFTRASVEGLRENLENRKATSRGLMTDFHEGFNS